MLKNANAMIIVNIIFKKTLTKIVRNGGEKASTLKKHSALKHSAFEAILKVGSVIKNI